MKQRVICGLVFRLFCDIMLDNIDIIGRLLLGALLGSLIGFERERQSWAAGLRTHMLVCVGSTLLMVVSAFGFRDILGTQGVELDPSRIAAQVVSGIGFLGAGSILLRGDVIRGLTTAASLWSVAAIGLAVGGGMYTASIVATVIILIILAGIKPLERRFIVARQEHRIRLLVKHGSLNLRGLRSTLGSTGSRVKEFVVYQCDGAPDLDEVRITLSRVSPTQYGVIRERLKVVPEVRELEESK